LSPSSAPPSSRTAKPPPSTRSAALPRNGCPVSAATLNRVPGLPAGYRITPDTVDCWKNWATGWDRKQIGDGMDLFRYTSGTGWRLHSQGSSFECDNLGIRVDPDDPPPFCT
jgi:hypothetical protein